jgi:hypothetical protein
LSAAHAAFRSRLEGPDRELADKFGLALYVAVATVARRKRAAGRVILHPGREDSFIALAAAMGVRCHTGRARIVSLPDAVDGSGHAGLFVLEDRPDASVIVYFALSNALASGAEAAELHGQHELVGSLFGYPGCCVASFIRQQVAGADYTAAGIPSLGPFPKAANPVVPYVYGAINTLFHFPCQVDCSHSLALRNARLAWLRDMQPEMSAYGQLGGGLALYGPELGIGLATDYQRLSDDTFAVRCIYTRSKTTAELFAAMPQVVMQLQGPHVVRLNERRYSHSSQFLALFE